MTSHSEPLYSDGDIEMKDLNDDEIEDIREAVEHTRAEAIHSGRKILPEFQPPHSFEAADRNFEAAPILLVVDTNFAISHLKIIDELVALQGDFGYLIVVPTTVVRELDGLKKDNGPWSRTQSNKNSDVAVYARQAIRWLFRALAVSHPAVRPQRLDERHSDKDMAADDSILDCCWYFQKNRDKPVVLLSGDYNLCIKALANGIATISYQPGLSARRIVKEVFRLSEELLVGLEDPSHQQKRRAADDTSLNDAKMDIDEIYHDLEGFFYLGSGQASTQSGAASSPLPQVRNRPNPKRSKLMRLVKTSPTDGSEPKSLKPSERAKLVRMNSENGSATTDNPGLQVTTNNGVKPRGMNSSDMIDDGNSVNDEYENETEMVIDAVPSATESKNKRGKRKANGVQKTTPIDAADAIPVTGGMKPSERARMLKQQTQEDELFIDDMLDGLLDLPPVLNTLKTNTEAVNQDRTKVNKPIIHNHHNVSHATVRKSRPAASERKYDFPDPKASIDSYVSSKNGGGRRRRSRSKHPPAAPP